MKRGRSGWLWVAALWFATLGVSALWRALALWDERTLLFALGSSLTPPALTAYVVLFCASGTAMVVAAAGLWFWRDWARHVGRISVTAYLLAAQTYTWGYVRSGLTWERRWVALGGAVLALTLSIGALTWRRARGWLGLE